MTADLWRSRVRFLLRDTGRGTSTGRKFFGETEISDEGTASREKLIAALRSRPPEAATLTLCRIVKIVAAVEGNPIPGDLFLLECGIRDDSVPSNDPDGYIPVRGVSLGEQMQGMDGVYADGALFHGTAAKAIYYATPNISLYGTANLTDFSDAFYNTLVTLTALTLVVKKSESYYKTRTPEGQLKVQRLQQLLKQQISTLS